MAERTNGTSGNGADLAQRVKTEAKRPIPLAFLVAAALGWLLFFVAIFWRQADMREYEARLADAETTYRTEFGTLETDLNERIALLTTERDDVQSRLLQTEEAVGGFDAAQARLTEGQAQLAELEAEIETVTLRRDAATAEAEEIEATLASTQDALSSASDELERAVADRDAAQAEEARVRSELEGAQARIDAAGQELVDVGARVEEARAQESGLRDTVATLTEEASVLAEQTAAAETEVQALREEDARLTAAIAERGDEVAALTEQRAGLEADVEALTERREALASDVTESEALRRTYQGQVEALAATLADRGAELAELEQQIGATQAEGNAAALPVEGEPSPAGDGGEAAPSEGSDASMPTLAGLYRADGVTAAFADDGTFAMRTERGRAARGSFTVGDGVLRLEDATGDIRRTTFPMVCGMESDGEGFTLAARDGSCRALDGLAFQPAQ